MIYKHIGFSRIVCYSRWMIMLLVILHLRIRQHEFRSGKVTPHVQMPRMIHSRPSYHAAASVFRLASSRSLNFFCDSCCLAAALSCLWRFRRPAPRLGPLMTTGSVMRFLRLAACSERVFSLFLSRLRRVENEDLRREP